MTDQRIFLHVECSGRTFRSFQNDSTSNLVVESDLLFLRGFYGQFFSFPLFFLSFLFPSFPFLGLTMINDAIFPNEQVLLDIIRNQLV